MKLILPLLLALSFSLPIWANDVIFGTALIGTATTGSSLVFADNSLRSYLLIVNTGSNTIYANFGTISGSSLVPAVPIPALGNYEPFRAPSNSVFLSTQTGSSNFVAIQGQ